MAATSFDPPKGRVRKVYRQLGGFCAQCKKPAREVLLHKGVKDPEFYCAECGASWPEV